MGNYRFLEMSQKFGHWLNESIKDFATENDLNYVSWHQDEPVFYIEGKECHQRYPGATPYRGVIQIIASDTVDGPVLYFTPHHNMAGIIKEDFRKLEQLLEQNKTGKFKNLVKKALSKAWKNETN